VSAQHVFFSYVVIRIRQLFYNYLTSTLLETGVGANDCKCNQDQRLNMPSEALRSSRYQILSTHPVTVHFVLFPRRNPLTDRTPRWLDGRHVWDSPSAWRPWEYPLNLLGLLSCPDWNDSGSALRLFSELLPGRPSLSRDLRQRAITRGHWLLTTGMWTRDLWFRSLDLRPLDQPSLSYK
jgi:hypothetical protein